MMCLNLIFMMVALSVIMFAIVPDYTTYGSQHFVANVTVDDKTQQVHNLYLIFATPSVVASN